jgi:hypothetical protein
MQKSLGFKIGFADAEVIGYENTGTDLNLFVRAWNARILVLSFVGVMGVCDRLVHDVTNVIEETEMSQFAVSVLERAYETVPLGHPYRLFQVLDLDDQPAMEVVAENVSLEIRESGD